MKFTGVLIKPSVVKQLKQAASMPAVMIGSYVPESPQQVCHRAAIAAGLPEIEGYYGAALNKNGKYEFVTVEVCSHS